MKRSIFGVALMMSVLVVSAFSQDPTGKSADSDRPIPKQIRGGILNGKAISLPKPEYPADARAGGLQGTVFVDVVIDESGTVVSALAATEPRKAKAPKDDLAIEREIEPADPILREAAENAALQARFSPTLLSGAPVKVSGTIVYNFVMDRPTAVKGGILNGKATSLPAPVYPAAAIAVRAAGVVIVEITIDENGVVIEAKAVSGHPLLRAAAVEAARSATFVPTRIEGTPIKVSGVVTYNFVVPNKGDTN